MGYINELNDVMSKIEEIAGKHDKRVSDVIYDMEREGGYR